MQNTFMLTIAAILPAVVLCVYIYKKDRIEKEPLSLLLYLLLAGAACCYPAAWIEEGILNILDIIFRFFAVSIENGVVYLTDSGYIVYRVLENFVGIALVEEGLKFLALLLLTRNSREFNCMFDGIVYAVFVSLGFAAFENIFYVLNNGWINALMRAFTSIPGHMFFGVFMGYYYSQWRMDKLARRYESVLQQQKRLPSGRAIDCLTSVILAVLVPVFAHGLYDYCCTYGGKIANLSFYIFIIVMYVYCFRKINHMSAYDSTVSESSVDLLAKHYSYSEDGSKLERR